MTQKYKLPKCWIGAYRSVISESAPADERITADDVNPACECSNQFFALYCDHGHLTECHAGLSCADALCAHYVQTYRGDDIEDRADPNLLDPM